MTRINDKVAIHIEGLVSCECPACQLTMKQALQELHQAVETILPFLDSRTMPAAIQLDIASQNAKRYL